MGDDWVFDAVAMLMFVAAFVAAFLCVAFVECQAVFCGS